jgi:hypothetical protein
MLWLLRHDERMMLRMYGLSLEGRIRQASLIQREAEEIIGDVLLAAGVERNARSARTVKDRSTGAHDPCSNCERIQENDASQGETMHLFIRGNHANF